MEVKTDTVYKTASDQLAHVEMVAPGDSSRPAIYTGAIVGRGLANWLSDGTSLLHKDLNLVQQTDELPPAHIDVYKDSKEEYA